MTGTKPALSIEYTVEVWREGSSFVARAMPLEVMSCGTTARTARDNLREAVNLFVLTAAEHGTLPEILRECGYRKLRRVWHAPRLLLREQVRQAVNA
jgi:predicted RNase H-like HicB family nuclease